MNTNLVEVTRAMGDETRQEIMNCLCCVWLNVSDIVEKLDGKIEQPTVSHHLRILNEAGLVFVRQEGRNRYYTLNQEQVTVCCGMLLRNFAPDFVQANAVIPLGSIKLSGKE